METPDRLSVTFSALAHPVRRAILAQLADGQATVNVLAKPHEMSLPAVSRHLKVLENAGLIRRETNAQYRPCSMNAEPLREVASWAEQYKPIWQARFDAMENCLNAMKGNVDEC